MAYLEHEKRVMKTKVQLGKNKPFFAYILMSMDIRASEHIGTMGVNKVGDLYYTPKFVESLSQDELYGVLCHEALHVALLTFQREGKRDHIVWNYAADLVINWVLREEGFVLPKDCMQADPQTGEWSFTGKKGKKYTVMVKDKTAEDIYNQIIDNVEVLKVWAFGDGAGSGEGKGGNEGKCGKGQFDRHIEGDKNDKGEGQGKLKGSADEKANEERWKGITTSAATAAKMRGTGSSLLDRLLDKLLNPEVDWRTKLYQFLTKDLPIDYTMRMPHSKSYSLGIYLPSVVREYLDVGVFPDVSGSIGADEFQKFISEAVGVGSAFPQMKMRVVFWADGVDPEDDIEVTPDSMDKLLTHKVKNSGGTRMGCIAEYLDKVDYHPKVAVFLTDGCIEGDPKIPENTHCLFVVSHNGQVDIVEKYGEVVKLNAGENGG